MAIHVYTQAGCACLIAIWLLVTHCCSCDSPQRLYVPLGMSEASGCALLGMSMIQQLALL